MNHDRRIEPLLDRWLAEGPVEVSDRVFDETLDRLLRQPQRPAWRVLWRDLHVTMPMRIAAAAAALVIAGFVGVNLLGRPTESTVGGPGPGGSPSPTADVAPTPTPTPPATSPRPYPCESELPGCAGELAAGEHASSHFEPPLTYTVPEAGPAGGWINVIDRPDIYKLDSPNIIGQSGAPYLLLWSNAQIVNYDAKIINPSDPCPLDPHPAPEHRRAEWIDFLTTHPGLFTGEARDIVLGEHTATQVELAVASSWTRRCANHDEPYVMFLTQSVEGQPTEYGLPKTERVLVTVVDVGDRTVVMLTYGPSDATEFARFTEPIHPVLESITFE